MKAIQRLAGAAVVLVVTALCCAAQVQPPAQNNNVDTSGAVRLNRAPVSKEVLRVRLPRPVRATLDSGLRVLIIEDHRAPMITMSLTIDGAGSLYDPSSRPGLAEFTNDLLREGTQKRTSKQIAQETSRLGVIFGGRTEGTNATLTAVGLSDNFSQWFDIYVDILLHPSFPGDELQLKKDQALVELKQERTSAGFLAEERFQRVLYGSHPAAVVSPTESSVRAMSRESISAFYRERYLPQNAILAVAGDVRPEEFIAKLRSALASWKKTKFKPALPPDPAAQTVTKIFVVDRPDSVQTNLLLGNLAITRRDPDFIPLTVMNEILGGGAAGRLFMNLREAKGYTYGAYSRVDAQDYIGTQVANSEVRTAVTQGAVSEFFNEFHRISEQPISPEDLDRAKRTIVAGFALSLEQPRSVLRYWLVAERYGFPETYWDNYPDQIMAVTAADVQRVARKYLDPNAVQVVAVGDASKIEKDLEKWGTVTVYNAAGDLVPDTSAEKPAPPPLERQ